MAKKKKESLMRKIERKLTEKEKDILKKLTVVGSGVTGALMGVPIGREVAAMQMPEILTAEQIATRPELVALASDVVTGSSVAGGLLSGVFSGLLLLSLYEKGIIKLPEAQARQLRKIVGKLETELKESGIHARKLFTRELHKLERVV